MTGKGKVQRGGGGGILIVVDGDGGVDNNGEVGARRRSPPHTRLCHDGNDNCDHHQQCCGNNLPPTTTSSSVMTTTGNGGIGRPSRTAAVTVTVVSEQQQEKRWTSSSPIPSSEMVSVANGGASGGRPRRDISTGTGEAAGVVEFSAVTRVSWGRYRGRRTKHILQQHRQRGGIIHRKLIVAALMTLFLLSSVATNASESLEVGQKTAAAAVLPGDSSSATSVTGNDTTKKVKVGETEAVVIPDAVTSMETKKKKDEVDTTDNATSSVSDKKKKVDVPIAGATTTTVVGEKKSEEEKESPQVVMTTTPGGGSNTAGGDDGASGAKNQNGIDGGVKSNLRVKQKPPPPESPTSGGGVAPLDLTGSVVAAALAVNEIQQAADAKNKKASGEQPQDNDEVQLYLYEGDPNTSPIQEYHHPGKDYARTKRRKQLEKDYEKMWKPQEELEDAAGEAAVKLVNGTGNATEIEVEKAYNEASTKLRKIFLKKKRNEILSKQTEKLGNMTNGTLVMVNGTTFTIRNGTVTNSTFVNNTNSEDPLDDNWLYENYMSDGGEGDKKDEQWFNALDLPDDTISIVEFYAPWCPHCQRYKPHYIQLAREIVKRAYGDVNIAFFAISCVANEDLCSEYDIHSYPKVYGFPLDPDGDPKKHDDFVHLNEVKEDMTAEIIAANLGFGIAKVDNKVDGKLQTLKDKEQQEEYVKAFPKLAMRSASTALKRHEYPRALEEVYHDAAKSFVFALKSGVFRGKAGTALGSSDPSQAAAFSQWLDLLSWSLPAEFGLRLLVQDIREEWDTAIKSKEDMMKIVNKHEIVRLGYVGPIPTTPRTLKLKNGAWSEACTHGYAGTGYTCGLWQLFHVVTVGVSIRYMDGFREGLEVSPHGAADTIRDYIYHFFGCEVCRSNFLKYYDSCGGDHCTRLGKDAIPSSTSQANEFPLWLWETHNRVNARLIKENAEAVDWRNVTDLETESSRFPTQRMCPGCWHGHGADYAKGNNGSGTATGWDEVVVYKFLRSNYWPNAGNYRDFRKADDAVTTSSVSRRQLSLYDHHVNEHGGGGYMGLYVVLLPLGVLLGFGAKSVMEKQRRRASGRHKKFEDSPVRPRKLVNEKPFRTC